MTSLMSNRLLATLLLSLSALAPAQAAEQDVRKELQLCAEPEYPREASRYWLAGQVAVEFDLTAAGAVDNITVFKGTGWSALDAAVVSAIAKCQFSAEAAASKQKFRANYVYKPMSTNPGISSPTMRPDTCPASDIFTGFISSRDENLNKTDGLAVRFDVDEVGRAHGVELENRAWDPRIQSAALDYIQACRYNPSKRAGIKAKGGMSGRLTMKVADSK